MRRWLEQGLIWASLPAETRLPCPDEPPAGRRVKKPEAPRAAPQASHRLLRAQNAGFENSERSEVELARTAERP